MEHIFNIELIAWLVISPVKYAPIPYLGIRNTMKIRHTVSEKTLLNSTLKLLSNEFNMVFNVTFINMNGQIGESFLVILTNSLLLNITAVIFAPIITKKATQNIPKATDKPMVIRL